MWPSVWKLEAVLLLPMKLQAKLLQIVIFLITLLLAIMVLQIKCLLLLPFPVHHDSNHLNMMGIGISLSNRIAIRALSMLMG
ncbi:MAG TPA: hypothetical protein DCG32_07520 [Sphaerochaeta sp.]|nr:hypothetical protein [Sphaerochaeta sp.]